MTDSLRDVEEDIRADVGDDETEPLAEFVDALREESDDSLRLVVRYRGDEHELLYVRDDVELTDEELEERVQSLALRGIGDPTHDAEMPEFGELEATLRWFEHSVVAIFPYREWSGVVAVFDRTGSSSPMVDAALDELRE